MAHSLTLGAGAAGGMAVDLLVILAVAGITAMALSRLRVAAIPGYLIAGILFGPHGLGFVSDIARIEEITSIATVLLMFSIGMHLDMSAMRRGAVAIVTIGAVSTLVSTAVITMLAMAMSVELPGAIAIGMALSMSSTAVVLQLFQARRELFEAHGRTSIGILLIQDLLVVGMLALLPVLAAMRSDAPDTEPIDLGAVATQSLIAIGAVGLLIVVGRLVLPRVMRFVAAGGNQELMLVVAAAAALGAAVLTGAAGLSPELGAFIAGFLLSSTPFRHHISGQITPLRDLFMAVFFTVVGMRVDPQAVLAGWWVVLSAIIVIPSVKTFIIALSTWAAGGASTVAVRTGLALGQSGEFSLLVLTIAASLGLIEPNVEGVVIAAVVATLVLTPWSVEHGAAIARRFGDIRPAPWFKVPTISEHPAVLEADGDDDTPKHARVIIAGFGPVGRTCAAKLASLGIRYTVVELNARTVWHEAASGTPILYGDVTNREVLENAGIDHAEIVVFTMPDGDAVFRGVHIVRSMRPEIRIIVRASLMQVAEFAKELGADEAFVEESAVADALAARLAEHLTGTPD
ncbi:MAG: cation:proton antiporter [Phycisphaerales bacterium]